MTGPLTSQREVLLALVRAADAHDGLEALEADLEDVLDVVREYAHRAYARREMRIKAAIAAWERGQS